MLASNSEESETTEHDEFTFETENMALKGNKDYLEMLKTLALLESQRIKAIQDIDILLELKDKALEDPIEFVNKLRNNEDLGIPTHQKIADLPEIDWSKYKVTLPAEVFRPQTRNLGSRCGGSNSSEKNLQSDVVKVRGRVYDPSKPITFNKLWTVEEQRKLEELLVQFPPEDNEMRRYTKIAKALGNRTPSQVSSRCQKYFKKLHMAGLPIPGRIPKSSKSESYRNPKYTSHKHQRNSSLLYPRSTFFPVFHPPVSMTEENESSSEVRTVEVKVKTEKEDETEDDISIPMEVKESDEYRKLLLLRRIQREKSLIDYKNGEHYGFKCDECEDDPIIGIRWHCEDCEQKTSIDFCSDCLINQLDKPVPHPLTHKLIAIRKTQVNNQIFDPDYNFHCLPTSSSTSYNYLDPNFIPSL